MLYAVEMYDFLPAGLPPAMLHMEKRHRRTILWTADRVLPFPLDMQKSLCTGQSFDRQNLLQ